MLFTSFTPMASAHVTKSDHGVNITMHINPDDDPIAGPQSMFLLKIDDKNNNFNLNNCICTARILENGKEIFATPISTNNISASLYDTIFAFPFPEKNTYQVIIDGKPITGEDFEPFSTTFDVRVDKEDKTKTAAPPTEANSLPILPIVAGGLFAFFGIILLLKSFGNKNTKLRLLSFLLIVTFLSIHLIPLELTPHHHDKGEKPIHNIFSFVPNVADNVETFVFEPIIIKLSKVNSIKIKTNGFPAFSSPNNKSPPA